MLNLLATAERAMSASEVARRLEITTSTCATVLRALASADYVERSEDKSYRLGPALLPLAQAMQQRFPILGAGHEELRRLSADLGCGVTLTRISTDHLRVVVAEGTDQRTPLAVAAGDRFPLTPPYGAIAMAWQDKREVEAWLGGWPSPGAPDKRAHERRVMADIRRDGVGVWSLDAHSLPALQRIRAIVEDLDDDRSSQQLRDQLTGLFAMFGRRGYTSDELATRGSISVGYALAAVFGPDCQPRYQIDLHLLRRSMSRAAVAEMLGRLRESSMTLTRAIGGQLPADVVVGDRPRQRRTG